MKQNRPMTLLNFCHIGVWILIGSLAIENSGHSCSFIADGPRTQWTAINYDWTTDGGFLFESPRGQVKFGFSLTQSEGTLKWISKYGSHTLSQFGRDFPMQGINEKGLMGAVLNGAASYPSKESKQHQVADFQWLQVQLDLYESVSEVAAHVQDLSLNAWTSGLHWVFCDRFGECGVLQFQDGKPLLLKGEDFQVKVLTNANYQSLIAKYESWKQSSTELPLGYHAAYRFIRLADQYESIVSRGRSTPEGLLEGLNRATSDSWTVWQGVFKVNPPEILVRSVKTSFPKKSWKKIPVTSSLRPCGSIRKMLDLTGSTSQWVDYDKESVRLLLRKASKSSPYLTELVQDKILDHTSFVQCD